MKSLYEIIKEGRPNITESSIKTYLFSLKKLGINTEEDIEKIENPNDIFDIVKDLKTAQQRNVISSVLIIIKALKMSDDLYEIYRKKCFDLGAEYTMELAKNEKTDTQSENWVSIDDMKAIANKKFKEQPQSQDTLIACLYSLQPPSRLDYFTMEIIKSIDGIDNTKNYLLINNMRRKVFIFNDYKTSKKYNSVHVPVSKELNTVINKFLKLNPERKYLLQTKKGVPLSRNQLGKLIPIAFKETGKNVTLNIIRHVFISEMVDIEAIKNCKTLCANMMHSEKTQFEYAKT